MAPATKILPNEPAPTAYFKPSTGNRVEELLYAIKLGFDEEEKEHQAFSLDRLPFIEAIFNYYFELGRELHRQGKRKLSEVEAELSSQGHDLILTTARQIAEQHYRIQVFLERYYSNYIEFCMEANSFRTCKLRSAIDFFFGIYNEEMDLEDEYGQLKEYFEMMKFEGQYYDLDERFEDWYKLECMLDKDVIPKDMPADHWWWF